MKCVYCGFDISDPSATFCASCGAPLSIPVSEPASSPIPVAPPAPAFASAPPVMQPMPNPEPVAPPNYASGAAESQPFPPAIPYPAIPLDQSVPAGYAPAVMPPAPAATCGHCRAPIPVGSPFCTYCGAPAPPPQPVRRPKKKMGKGALAAIIIIISIVVLAGGTLVGFLAVRDSRYNKAVEAMNNGQYQEAQEEFESWILSNYKESAENAVYCRNTILYNQAMEALNNGDYANAAIYFDDIRDFRDSRAQRDFCLRFIEAMSYFNDGQYWAAYDIFDSLDGSEAVMWKERCIQISPEDGLFEEGPAYRTGNARLIVDSRIIKDLYFSVYTADGEYWGSLFISAFGKVSVDIAPGTYYFSGAVGYDWFGSEDLFGHGTGADYQERITVNGQPEYTIRNNYEHTIRFG